MVLLWIPSLTFLLKFLFSSAILKPLPPSVYSPKLGTAIPIDGIDTKLKQKFNTIEDTHFSVTTSKGNLDVDLQIPKNFPVRARLYLNSAWPVIFITIKYN